jgi:L-alanine-DL-glutamate epimerase-like enolase superfamily enzyme
MPLAAASPALRTEIFRLKLRHTWTTVMSSSDYRDIIRLRFEHDGITGVGEGAPIVRYKEDARSAQAAIESVRSAFLSADPAQYQKIETELFPRIPGQYAAKAAIDIALLDWTGRKLGVPIYRLLGLDASAAPVTTFSIGIDTPEITRQKVREAAEFPVLKVKVGLKTDEATIEAVRSETSKPLRVDANEGWTDREEALRKIQWLEKQGAELIEQPLPADRTEDIRWLRGKVNMPIFADEASLHPEDIPKIADAYDGINIKLMKCGGMLEALRMIHIARAFKLKVMLGCMIESSASITAAAHIASLADYVDLDGNLLIANDPWKGVEVRQGKLFLPSRPGLGLTPRT